MLPAVSVRRLGFTHTQMAFYDHFTSAETITLLGKKIIEYQYNHFVNLIKKYSNTKGFSLLEIGPGKGFFSEICRQNNFKYTAIEGNKLMYQNLVNRGFNVHNDLVPPIRLDENFDIIFMDQVFEHMKNRDDAIKLIESCKDRLNSNGLLLVACPDILSVKEDFYQDYTHDYPTSVNRINQLFVDNDIEVLYKNYYTFFVRGYLATRVVAFLSRFFYGLGILTLVYNKKAYKVKVSLLPSFLIIGRKS